MLNPSKWRTPLYITYHIIAEINIICKEMIFTKNKEKFVGNLQNRIIGLFDSIFIILCPKKYKKLYF